MGRYATSTVQVPRMIVTAIKARPDSGNISAMMIPATAMSDNPTNGWRGPLRDLILLLFLHFVAAKQAHISAVVRWRCRVMKEVDGALRVSASIAHIRVAP